MENGIPDIWWPITESVKTGSLVRIKHDLRPEWGTHVMFWDHSHQRWQGQAFALFGQRTMYWSASEQPTHYQPLSNLEKP